MNAPTPGTTLAVTPARPCWVWPFHHRADTAQRLWSLAGLALPLCRGAHLFWIAPFIGAAPLLGCYMLGMPGHNWITAILMLPIFLALVREDWQNQAFVFTLLVFFAHCGLAIGLASHNAAGASAIMPGGADYLDKQLHWIYTGVDPEYDVSNWLPAHMQLLGAISFFDFTSLGVVPFAQGIKEVDLMNYYVAGLLQHSRSSTVSITVGWHPWSVLRGLAFAVLIYEVASISLERLCARPLTTRRRRALRWALGIALLLADGVAKYSTLELVRATLLNNQT